MPRCRPPDFFCAASAEKTPICRPVSLCSFVKLERHQDLLESLAKEPCVGHQASWAGNAGKFRIAIHDQHL